MSKALKEMILAVAIAFFVFLMGAIFGHDTKASENHVTIGLYTKHYENYSDELNEDNRLTQFTHIDKDGLMVVGSTFINSHGVRTYAVGAGLAHDNMGFAIIAIHGYEGYLRQHFEDVMFAPTSYYLHNVHGNHSIKINIVPTVYNVGYNYKF